MVQFCLKKGTLLLTSVTFKWITNRSLPTVSYMTSLDKYSISSMLFICAQCIYFYFFIKSKIALSLILFKK